MPRRPRDFAKDLGALKILLRPFVEIWGLERVRSVLENWQGAEAAGKAAPKKKQSSKPSAERMVGAMEVPMDRRHLLARLGKGLDNKQFLPTAGAIRNFLEMRGIQGAPFKSRQDAFRTVLEILREMPTERLGYYVDSMQHPGPADLASISDAIGRAGARRTRADHGSPDSASSDATQPAAEFANRT